MVVHVWFVFSFVAFPAFVSGQVTDYIRAQPTLKLASFIQCCDFLWFNPSDTTFLDLTACANTTSQPPPGQTPQSRLPAAHGFANDNNNPTDSGSVEKDSVALVTFVTSHIVEYSAYSIAAVAAYAAQNNYFLRVDSPSTIEDSESGDQRWNKVKVLEIAMSTWASKIEFLVWFDADLIFLDLGMKIELIAQSYSWADLIFAKDPKGENGIMNSGCIIVRNTAWSRQFMATWWTTFDRNDVMDQHVFDYLWYYNHAEMSAHIALLHPDSINTNFPSWKNQQSHNQVLHLAGCSNNMRATIFKTALTEVCSAAQGNLALKHQLGVTRQYINQVVSELSSMSALDVIFAHIDNVNREYVVPNLVQHCSEQVYRTRVSKIGSLLQDAIRVVNEESIASGQSEESIHSGVQSSPSKKRILLALRWVYEALQSLQITVELHDRSASERGSGCPNAQTSERIVLLQDLLESAFNLAQWEVDQDLLQALLAEMSSYVEKLLQLTRPTPDLYARVLYYKFKHLEFYAALLADMPGWSETQASVLLTARETFHEMQAMRAFGSGNGVTDPYKEGANIVEELASVQCRAKNFTSGLQFAFESIDLVDQVWGGAVGSASTGSAPGLRAILIQDVEQKIAANSKSIASHSVTGEGLQDGENGERYMYASVAESLLRKFIITLACMLDGLQAGLLEEREVLERSAAIRSRAAEVWKTYRLVEQETSGRERFDVHGVLRDRLASVEKRFAKLHISSSFSSSTSSSSPPPLRPAVNFEPQTQLKFEFSPNSKSRASLHPEDQRQVVVESTKSALTESGTDSSKDPSYSRHRRGSIIYRRRKTSTQTLQPKL